MKLFLFAVLISFSVSEFLDDPDYRPAFLHRTRGAFIEKHRIGVQLPQSESQEEGKSIEVEENDKEFDLIGDENDEEGKPLSRERRDTSDEVNDKEFDLIVDENDEEGKPLGRSRRDASDEVNDGPGGAFEVKDSTDGQEGDDSLVELGDGRFGDSNGQGQERSGRFRRMLFSDRQESRRFPAHRFPAHRRPFGIKNHCKIDKKGKRKCFLRDPDDQSMKSVKARERKALSHSITDIQLENDQEFNEKLKDLKQWKHRKGQEDEDEKSDLAIKRRRTFRRRCQIEGINGRRRCFPRPERQLESPKKENREHRKRNPDRQL